MPPNPPDNRLDKGSSDPPNVAETPQVAMTLWSLYLEEANERAKAKADMWNSSIGAFLLFAGLFAGVVASFVIDSRTGLKPNPSAPVPATTVAINFLWFLSLTFTLISALAAVLAQTWVVKFSLAPTKGFEAAKERWIHDNKADRWRLHTAIAWITVLIQLALFLFLAGFAVQAVVDNRDIGWTILSLVGTTVVLYIIITILPWLSPTSPFRTPFSDLNTRNQSVYLSDSSSLRPAARGAKDRTIYAWQSLRSSWHDLIETPEPSHVRLGICSWILRNSFKNGSIHAAVVELTRNPLTQENCERLVQFGLPDDLCIRLTELVNSPDSSARVERMNNFLRAIIWMVNGAIPRVEVTKVAKGFYPLLGLEGALLTLDVLPAECRALAFGVRVHLLLSGCDGKEIQATDWNTMVDNLEHDSALSVFRAATRGLESDDKHLPQDCARMLAVYIGSARFSNESLAADQTEYVRFFKIQPEPVRLIQRFFKELEQAWKVSMCSRAIQLLEETRFDLQVAGLRALSYLAENHTFRTTVHEALPHLFKILKDVDWHTSVACLQKLSDIYKQEPFRRAINAIFPDIIALLSDPDERVRSAVLQLSDLVDQDELIDSIKDISGDLIKDLQDPDWSIRVARLQILTELIKTGKIPTVIENAVPNILDCLSFSDEDVRLRAIQALHEIAQHGAFKHLINTNMPVIVMCMSDDDSRVCAALVRFLSDLAPQDTFKEAINDNFRAIVDDTLESEEGTVRRSGLRALCELIKSDQYVGAIKNAFCDLQIWLSDTDEDVREAALQAVSLASEKGAFLAIITEIIPKVVLMLKDPQENVRTSAIETFSTLAKDERGSFSDAIKLAIPAITSGLDPESTEGTQIATLKALSILATTDDLCQSVHDNALDKIILCLADQDDDVCTQVLATLAELATIGLFHNKLKTAIPSIFPQLENDWEEVRQAAVRAVSVFAKQNLFLDSNFNTDSHTISLLSHMDSAISLVGLQILSILKRQGGGMNTDVFEISDVVNLLKSDDMPVRLAGLRALQSLATDGRRYHEINLKPTIPDIIECVWDPAEDVRAAALETLGNFANNATFRDQVAMPEIESTTVESLLRSKTREIRLSIIHTIPKLINKAEFYPIINGAMPAMIKILTDSTDEETRVAMIQTVRNMVETGSVTSDEFVDLVGHTIPLLSDPQEDVRAIALQTFSVISKQELFSQIISGHLPELVATACQRNETGINEDEDIFRIQVLEILSSLAAQEKFRKAIGTTIFTDNTFTVKAETWPTRVAILNLMSSLAAKDGLKTAVNQIIPDIADALHDDENQDIRLAGVRFLSIPMVKEMFHDILNEFVPTLVDLLSDSEEEIRVAVLHTLSDLAKQDGYRKAINGALPALLDALKRGDWKTRVTALETWSALAQDGTFSDIVTSATPNISACLEDYDVDVRTAALATLSEFSQEEVFRLAIINAAPHVISGLENSHWRTRVKVLETLLKFAKNDAFEEIIIIFVPKILESLKDSDEDVRFAGLGILSHLIQQDAYCASIHGALQASDISTLEHLLSDQYQHVRIGAIQLFPKVIQLDNSLDSTATALSNLGHVLSDDKEVCIAALEAISMLVTQDMPDTNLTPVISKVIQLMKPDIADTVCEAVLRTLSAFATKDKCIESITAALPAILSAFMTTEEQHCRDAAAQVFLVLASHATSPETVHTTVLPILLSTLTNDNWHICVAGLNALSEFVQQEALDEQISEDIPSILNLLRHPKDEVRIAATGMAVLLCGSRPEIRDEVRPVLKNLWDNVLVDFTNSEPITRVAALGKLPKLTEFAALLDNVPFTGFEVPIITALKDQNQDLYLLGLSILSKLVDNNRFRERLLGTISKVTALLSNKASHTRVEVLNNLLKLAEHKDCRQEIRKEVGEIISVLKDREPTVRSAGLKVLIKLAEEGVIPDRIKLTTPHLLTLVQSLHTRKDAVLLLTSLAREKTLRSELLSKLIPLLEESPVVSWGHLVLVESLFENERLGIEPSDLQFVLCFMMSKQTEVQDFILKFMTSTLQHYLETWRNTSTFPASVASIFSSALPRSRN